MPQCVSKGARRHLEYMGTRRAQTVGEYNVIRLIGNGGMGAVYEVEHRALGVRYALKTFALDRGEVDFLRERFIAEARALARLSHTWSPELPPEQAALRAYTIYGKTNLTDRAWHSPTHAASRFFKVGVEMR